MPEHKPVGLAPARRAAESDESSTEERVGTGSAALPAGYLQHYGISSTKQGAARGQGPARSLPPGYLDHYGIHSDRPKAPVTLSRSTEGLTVQRKADGSAAPDAQPDQGKGDAGTMLAEDSGAPQPGQLRRGEFLAQLKQAVTEAATAALDPIWSAAGCPYIERWFAEHANTDAASIDKMARRYSGVASPRSAIDYIAPICARLRAGIVRWRSGEDVSAELTAAGVSGAAVPPPAAATAAAAPSKDGVVQTQAAPGATPGEPGSPARMRAELGAGTALDPGTSARMGDAFGHDFADVRVHTDADAGARASSLGARAFTVGEHVAFAPGLYQPGSPTGDALLAHELAHVVQQRGAPAEGAALRKKDASALGDEAHEVEADQAAESVLTRLYAGGRSAVGRIAGRVAPALRSPLQLQRCDGAKAPAPKPTPSAASGSKDLMAGTQAPDATQKGEIDTLLDPTHSTATTASKPFIPKDFDKDMRAAIQTWTNDSYNNYSALDKGGKDVQQLDMPQVRKTGKAAQNAVNDKWGAYIKGAAPDADTATSDPAFDVSSAGVLHQQEETIDPLPKAGKDDMVAGLIEYAMRQASGGKPVAKAHNLNPDTHDPTRAADVKARQDFIKSFMSNVDNYKKLVEIQRMWPGEEHPWDNTVYIQLKRWKDPKLEAQAKADPTLKDVHLRQGYWASFQTLIHEYIHACVHANFRRAEGQGQKNQVLSEGGDDWLVTKLWPDVAAKIPGDDALRERVEGKKYPYRSEVIPPLNRYDEWKDVDAFIKKMGTNGEANFVAAYFLGHVELLGLGKWTDKMAAAADTYDVVVDDFPVSLVADKTFVDEATIRSANGLGPTDNLKKGTAKVPGVSYHSCVPSDNLTIIAQQHGVTEDALKKANNHVSDWNKLYDGQQILIPKH